MKIGSEKFLRRGSAETPSISKSWMKSKDFAVCYLKNAMLPCKVVFFVGPKPKVETIQRLTRKFRLWDGQVPIEPISDTSHATTYSFSGEGCFVWVQSLERCYMGSLMHELIHVSSYFVKSVGHSPNWGADEFQAYYIGWLVKELLSTL